MGKNILDKSFFNGKIDIEYYSLILQEYDNSIFSLSLINFCDERGSMSQMDEVGLIKQSGQVRALATTYNYSDLSDDDYESLQEWVDGALFVSYINSSANGRDLSSNPQRERMLSITKAKMNAQSRYLAGLSIEVDVTKVDYNNFKEEDSPKTAIWCGEVGEYTVIGSIDANEFCIKEFTKKVKINKSYCKSFRFIKTKYIIRRYECKISL